MAGVGTSGLGPGGSARFSGFRHGGLDGRNNSFRYPSPWWDIASMDLPKSIKSLFRRCRYHMLVNPLISSVVRKMSSYPITDLVIDDSPEEGFGKAVKKWEDCLLRVLNIPAFQLEVGLDYHGYGNCLVSILYPFHKSLSCAKCKKKTRISRLAYKSEWSFRNFNYILNCKSCGHSGKANVSDDYYRSYRDIKLIRWSPEDIDIDFNPITRVSTYRYSIPAKVRAQIVKGDKSYLETMPIALIEALRAKRPFVLTKENVFHFKAPTPSLDSNDEGWGYPPILPALKDSFYLQIMKKAQEAVMLEHLVPLDILFPASADTNANPYLTINLKDWKSQVEAEVGRWRFDPNYKPIMPVPVGHQRIGGNGRALMLTQEIRAMSEHIIAGMGVPQEFVFGGLSYSGTSVSLRMLENQFITYRTTHEHFLQHFLIPNIARFMGWQEVPVHMKSFKMADDTNSKQLLIRLNQLRKISDKTLLSEFGKDSLAETKLIEQELRRSLGIQKMDSIYKAQIQGEQQSVATKFQIKNQEVMQEAQQKLQKKMQEAQQQVAGQQQQQQSAQQQQQSAQQPSLNALEMAESYAKRLAGLDESARATVLSRMAQEMPQLHSVVATRLQDILDKKLANDVDPLPERGAPRRNGGLG